MTYTQRAEQKVQEIAKKWKSPQYRAAKALHEADFYIDMMAWVTESDKPALRAAIEVYRVFIDSLV
jgi:hypothetical protein